MPKSSNVKVSSRKGIKIEVEPLFERPEIFIGIDPGMTGGLTYISGNRVECDIMPQTETEIWQWFQNLPNRPKHAVIEKVWASPTQGRKQGGSSMFKFGYSYGFVRACLIAAAIPFDEAVPQRWQKEFSLKGKKSFASGTLWKKYLKGVAQRLLPRANVIQAAADSALIAEYCRRKNQR